MKRRKRGKDESEPRSPVRSPIEDAVLEGAELSRLSVRRNAAARDHTRTPRRSPIEEAVLSAPALPAQRARPPQRRLLTSETKLARRRRGGR